MPDPHFKTMLLSSSGWFETDADTLSNLILNKVDLYNRWRLLETKQIMHFVFMPSASS